jgi:hypothetical protein
MRVGFQPASTEPWKERQRAELIAIDIAEIDAKLLKPIRTAPRWTKIPMRLGMDLVGISVPLLVHHVRVI